MYSLLHSVYFEDVVNSLKNGLSFAMKIGKDHGIMKMLNTFLH
jgi:hypothetical protein